MTKGIYASTQHEHNQGYLWMKPTRFVQNYFKIR